MSNTTQDFWSNDPNAPQVQYPLYFAEKAYFTGALLGAASYGVVVVLFFQSMRTLLNPVDHTRGIRWLLVVHTAAMFSFATIYAAVYLDLLSIFFIDKRGFSSDDGLPPGPLGYQHFTFSRTISVVPRTMFLLNNWLVDGLLLYRCYVIFAMHSWVVALPCLIYISSYAMGIMFIYHTSQPGCKACIIDTIAIGTPYFSISVSLNVLLTLMIVTRLVLHSRDIRDSMGPLVRLDGLYKAIVTVLIESCSLYAITFVLFIGTWATTSSLEFVFFPILAQTQVIAPFLIILRVTDRRRLADDTLSGNVNSINFGREGLGSGNDAILGGYHADPANSREKSPEGFCVGVATKTGSDSSDLDLKSKGYLGA